ncbi:MAG TPA: amidase family protein [Gemmatimonadaceae bacterium]|nr:amidase family protein [Gemmatimonadaceae bacterium]
MMMRGTTGLMLMAVISAAGAQATPRIVSPKLDTVVVEATITDLQRGMSERRFTALDLTRAYLARIAAYDQKGPTLNSMVRVNPAAERDARAMDTERRAGKVRGPLHGIPIILKDNYNTADMPTTGSTLALATFTPREDAFIVRRLRDAGAIIIGKSNLHELAAGITSVSSMGGQTRNPYDPRRCPGGSSGGTGAAIAASFAAVGWGSDTCGSIRIPAAFGSLYGLRPTSGVVSRHGVIPLSHTQDVTGPLARTVTDLAIALDFTVGRDTADAATAVLDGRELPRFAAALNKDALRGKRLGILRNYMTGTDGDIADSIRSTARAMGALGAEVIDVTIPNLDSLIAGTGVIGFEFKWDLMDFFARFPGAPVSSLRDILERGLHHEALDATFRIRDSISTRDSEPYKAALRKQAALKLRLVALFDSLNLDALIYPTMQRRPAFVGEAQQGATCSLSAQSGLPALSLPAGFTNDGLPVGLEMMGKPFDDVKLVAMAYAFEQSPGGARRRAPLTTPVLRNGQPPGVQTYRARAGSASVSFRFDALRSELHYDVRMPETSMRSSQAIALRRTDAAGAGVSAPRVRVVQRLIGPGLALSSGVIPLGELDRRALGDGRLGIVHVTSETPLGRAATVERTLR